MTTFFLACLALCGAAALYVPVVRAWHLWRRYGTAERRFIRAGDARLERDPGDLATALALLELYRTHADHVRLRALYQHTRAHLEGRPEYEPLRRAALVGPFVVPPLLPLPELKGGNTFNKDGQQATGRLRLESLSIQGLVDVVQLEVELAGMGERSAAVPPELRVLSLEAVISEERVNASLAGATDLPPGLSDVRLHFAGGEITLAGSFFRVPFRMALAVRPASERALLFHLPRAVQILGIPTIPATILAEKIVHAIQSHYPELITVLDNTTFVLDLVAHSPMPLRLNLSSIAITAGELVIQARDGHAARLDLGPWRLPAPRSVPLLAAAMTSPEKAHAEPVTSSSPEEYRRALAAGHLDQALTVGLRLLASRPLDSVLREELVALALRTGETKRAVDLALERLADLPGGPAHPAARLRLMAGQALAGLGRKEEAEVHLEGLERELAAPLAAPLGAPAPGAAEGREPASSEGLVHDLVTLATLRVRLFGDLERGAQALQSVVLAAGAAPPPGDADPLVEPLRQAVQLAWEAGRPELCEQLAARLVAASAFESAAWRLQGLALRRRRQSFRAYSALAAAAWLNPLDRVAVDEAAAQRAEVAAALSAPPPSRLAPAEAAHPAEDAGAGPVLRLIVPLLADLLLDAPAELQETHAVATDESHAVLLQIVRAAAAVLELPVPEVRVIPDLTPLVEAAPLARPTIRVHSGALAELTHDELVYAAARAVWQAGRGDARWKRLARPQHRVLAGVLATLQRESAWRSAAERWAATSPLAALVPTALRAWAGEAFAETWPAEAAVARLLPADLRAEAQRLARALPRRPIAADVEAWCAALEFSADRAALLVCRDVAAALGALLKAELHSRTLLAQVRERGLPWALQTLLPARFAPRVRETLLASISPALAASVPDPAPPL